MMRPLACPVSLLVAVTFLLAGCSDEQQEPPALSNSGIEALMTAQWRFTQDSIAECMAGQGFDYTPEPFDDTRLTSAAGSDPQARFMELALTVEQARDRGFGVTADIGQPIWSERSEDPNSAYASSLSPQEYAAYQLALEDDDGGCRSKASAAAEKEFAEPLARLEDSATQVRTFVFSSKVFEGISSSWSKCMRDRGWPEAVITEFDAVTREEAQRRLDRIAIQVPAGEEDSGPPEVRYPPKEFGRVRAFEVGAAVDYVECLEPHRDEYAALLDQAYDQLP